MVKASLAVGDSLVYEWGRGWFRVPNASTVESGFFGDGSAAAPSITFSADPDTGLYRIGANILGFATGGVERLRIDATGLLTAAAGLTFAGPLLFSTDNAQDIGASGATRPRSIYVGTSVRVGTNPAQSGALRLGNAANILWRSFAGTSDQGIRLDANDDLIVDLGSGKSLKPATTNAHDLGTSAFTWHDGHFGAALNWYTSLVLRNATDQVGVLGKHKTITGAGTNNSLALFAETGLDMYFFVDGLVAVQMLLQRDAAIAALDVALQIRNKDSAGTARTSQITLGAVDSGGAGFRLLRVLN